MRSAAPRALLRLASPCFSTSRCSISPLRISSRARSFSAKMRRDTSTARQAPSAPPEGQLVPAFSPDLYGYHRGARGAVEEPLDVWLALLADAVPFYAESLIMVPRSWAPDRQKALWRRGQQHLPGAHLSMLPDPIATPTATPAAAGAPRRALPAAHVGSVEMAEASAVSCAVTDVNMPSSPASDGSASSSSFLPSASAPLAPRLNALDTAASHSLDLIVLAGNVFADEMFFHAPWYISMAHRALRPHGVLAIFGASPEVDVVAPAWVGEDVADYLASLQSDARKAVEKLRTRVASLTRRDREAKSDDLEKHTLARTRQLLTELEQALTVEASTREGHRDVYFPFRGVQRRSLTSEYAMTPTQLIALLRAMPVYQLLHDPLLTTLSHYEDDGVRENENNNTVRAAEEPEDISVNANAEADFVVDRSPHIEQLLRQGQVADGMEETAACAEPSLDPPGVRRQPAAVDGLEMLEMYLNARLSQEGAGSARTRSLRVHVRHFVVTCSGRSMNDRSSFDSFDNAHTTRLPARGAPRLPNARMGR